MSLTNQSPLRVRFKEDRSCQIFRRVSEYGLAPGTEGAPFVQADFSAIALYVYDVTGAAIVTGFNGTALTIASVIFDTLQPWWVDSTGHNFRYTIGPTAFPTGDSIYRVEVKFTMTDGRVGGAEWEGVAEKVYGS